MSSSAASMTTGSDDFIRKASDAWKSIKGVKKISEPLSKIGGAFGLADQAMSGTLPAYNPDLEKVREFIAHQKDTLAELARRDENDWMDRSALAESSLPALDGIAMGPIVGDLNNSEWSLDLIVRRLRDCRSALR